MVNKNQDTGLMKRSEESRCVREGKARLASGSGGVAAHNKTNRSV